MDKPAYRVPNMAEIGAIQPNGYRVVSTFSGAGGSSLGYRMAGFTVVWVNEFVEAARDTYAANANPATVIDGRDIRDVTPADILSATSMQAGELDVLDGSPPCAAFSMAGARSRKWGEVSRYSDTEQRSDDLFYEYARLLDGLQPRVFVAENVPGLVRGSAKGYFKEIFRALHRCGYRVGARLLDAQWLGVPQTRRRVFFIGVREDLKLDPVFPSPLHYRYTVAEVLPWIAQFGTAPPHADFLATGRDVRTTMQTAASGAAPTVMAEGLNKGVGVVADRPTVTVGAGSVNNSHHYQVAELLLREGGVGEPAAPQTLDQPAPTVLSHARGRNQIGVMEPLDQPARTVMANEGIGGGNRGQVGIAEGSSDVWVDGRAIDPETGKDITIDDKHATGRRWPDRRLRKFTLGELRRICGFPDDFVLTGTYQQRWERLGRAVPPPVMAAIANGLQGILEEADHG